MILLVGSDNLLTFLLMILWLRMDKFGSISSNKVLLAVQMAKACLLGVLLLYCC
jgi:hypothetical protein